MGYFFIMIYLAIILAVIEINVILFTLTGLEKHISRFQVISMLTGTGFTTGESELIIEHPIRRRLGTFLILFGAFSLAVIISTISSILSDDFLTKEITYVAIILFVLIFILKRPFIRQRIASTFKHDLEKNYDLGDMPLKEAILKTDNDYILVYAISETNSYKGMVLKDIIKPNEDIIVLFIERGGQFIRKNGLTTPLHAGDMIMLYGNKEDILIRFREEAES